ncbi:hypothetical protein SRDD_08610 [Serratia sp. DD3]|nr:hypothetical protein SRDD_08610 [Serratia sp. DD3]
MLALPILIAEPVLALITPLVLSILMAILSGILLSKLIPATVLVITPWLITFPVPTVELILCKIPVALRMVPSFLTKILPVAVVAVVSAVIPVPKETFAVPSEISAPERI